MSVLIDKEALVQMLDVLTKQEPDYVENLVNNIQDKLKANRRKNIEHLIKETFDEYDEVFKALA